MTDEAATQDETSNVSDLAHRVGEDLSDLVQNELEAAKAELAAPAREGAAGVGLVGGAAVAGTMGLLFGSIAVWRMLGDRIGYTRSAVLLSLLCGGSAAALSLRGGEQLAQVLKRLR